MTAFPVDIRPTRRGERLAQVVLRLRSRPYADAEALSLRWDGRAKLHVPGGSPSAIATLLLDAIGRRNQISAVDRFEHYWARWLALVAAKPQRAARKAGGA